MDTVDKLQNRLREISTELQDTQKRVIQLQNQRREIETGLQVIARYASGSKSNLVSENHTLTDNESRSGGTLTDNILSAVETVAKGISAPDIKRHIETKYGRTDVKLKTISVVLQRYKEKGRLKKNDRLWFPAS